MMSHWSWRFGFLVAVLVCGVSAKAYETPVASVRESVQGFQLTDASGKVISVSVQPEKQLTVICFLGTECPLARLYAPRLNQLSSQYADRHVRFIGVNSNWHDTPREVAEFARDHHLSFPVCKDPANQIADVFGAKYISEVFVIDQTLAIRYHGRVDDQYRPGLSRSQATREDLRLALDELLADQPVSVPRTEASGCYIGRVKTPDANPRFTFCRDVSRILNRNCVECHRPGEIGPFSLTDYHEVQGWGPTLIEAIDAQRMPPWNANPQVGHFRNARAMSDDDKQTLRDWVNAGMPFGDAADLPEKPEFASGWQLGGEPDLVVKMRERPFHVPATGAVEYQYFVVDPHLQEDRWVCAAQVIPGNRSIVHHSIIFIRPPDGVAVRGIGYLAGYVPGQRNLRLPAGYARRLPAGSKLVFQMHYTPNGTEQDDLTQVGIRFIPENEVTHETLAVLAMEQEFEIPPYAADFPVQAKVRWFPKQGELLAIIPHMHVRGKSFQASSRSGNSQQVLLDVLRYNFNWQHIYELSQPLSLAAIDSLEMTARFDNSKQNPVNPDPSQTVTWGDQTWEEMALAFFEVAEPRTAESEPERTINAATQNPLVKTAEQKSDEADAVRFVDDFFFRFDKNRDGKVEPNETPISFRNFGFNRYDSNDDKILTRDEIEAAAKNHRKK